MKITLLCSDESHPVNPYLVQWMARHRDTHEVTLLRRASELPGGDLLFLVSCSEIITAKQRAGYRAALVLHASRLPQGRGWSPHVWQILAGARELTLTLLEAEDQVDSGRIWAQTTFPVPSHALWDEINQRLFQATLELMDFAVHEFDRVEPRPQAQDIEPTYYRRRRQEDSRIDPERDIASQFDLIRICDPQRYPAFFELRGHTYKLIVEKMNDPSDQD